MPLSPEENAVLVAGQRYQAALQLLEALKAEKGVKQGEIAAVDARLDVARVEARDARQALKAAASALPS